MDLNEKLIALRKEKGWTQEQLAEALYVSRTAVSKWESGRGFPGIASLKAISELFSVPVDELLSNKELIKVAETDVKERTDKTSSIILGLVDCMLGLLMFLPFFKQATEQGFLSVPLIELTEISPYIKALYFVLILTASILGILNLAFQNFQNAFWQKFIRYFSVILSVATLFIFILSSQPYAASFLLFILITKGYLVLKSR